MWGERITRSVVMRALCGAWLVPAASLIWIGLANAGIRRSSEASQAIALGRTQATAVLLAVFTVLVGASVLVRQWPIMAAADRLDPDDGAGRDEATLPLWLWSHLTGAALVVPAVLVGATVERTAPILLPAAALAGFWAGLALARGLVRHPEAWSGPLAALAVGISFQLSVGWLHLAHPAALASPMLMAEGMILAWAAASAARVDPFAVPVVVVEAVPAELAGANGFSRAPAQRPIQEAAVGR